MEPVLGVVWVEADFGVFVVEEVLDFLGPGFVPGLGEDAASSPAVGVGGVAAVAVAELEGGLEDGFGEFDVHGWFLLRPFCH